MSTQQNSIDMAVLVHDHCLCGKYVIVYVQTEARARTNTYTHTDVYLHMYVVHFHVGTRGNSCVWGLKFDHVQIWRYTGTIHTCMQIHTDILVHTHIRTCLSYLCSIGCSHPSADFESSTRTVTQHNALQHTAHLTLPVHRCNPIPANTRQHTATHCNTECKAPHCTTLADHLSMYVCVLCMSERTRA